MIAGAPFAVFSAYTLPLDIGLWNHLVNLVVSPGIASFYVGLLGLLGVFSYRYRLGDQVLEVRSYGWVVRTHPGRGYDRIEIVNGKLYQTKDNGSTRRIRIWTWLINSDDWAVFKAVAPPKPPEPEPELLTVRYNRRRVAWLLVASIPITLVGLFMWSRASAFSTFTSLEFWLSYLAFIAGFNGAALSIRALSHKVCFSYDPRRRVVTGRNRWSGRTRWYPTNPSERLEYSVSTGTVYRVAADGKRRRFIRASRWLREDDWAAFIDNMFATTEMPFRPSGSESEIQVRVNLLRAGSVAAIGLGLGFVFVVLDPGQPGFWFEFLYGIATATCVLSGIDAAKPLWFRRFLTFDPGKGRVILRPGTKRLTVFPSSGFERIEYSIYDARVYEVRANGERRQLPIPRGYMNRTDWQKFADAMIAHRQEQSVTGEPS
ncbi:hypothetical protein [Glycomyces dulcitolivorans]|uniref:hypothetical protein n=1 Tax=Glycomyces dulcitolivorans TaxID=2200759 RepID=UPI001300935A|nr:hypothetical protein [Glycomyces dulcitolivorans]